MLIAACASRLPLLERFFAAAMMLMPMLDYFSLIFDV